MNIYRMEYTETIYRITSNRVIFFEAADDAAAVTEANTRFPAGATGKKLYNIGTLVDLE